MEYTIQAGDNFYRLAQHNGCCWQDFVSCNPGVDPCQLQVGQKITLPVVAISPQPTSACHGYAGKGRCDDVIVEVEGVKFKVTRMGEPSVPHEVHLILPRTEICKVEHPATGIIETHIMISNINIVNSPRFEGERIDRAEGTTNGNENSTGSSGPGGNGFGSSNGNNTGNNPEYGYGYGYNYGQ